MIVTVQEDFPNKLSQVLFISVRKAFLEHWLVRAVLRLGHPIAWT